MDYKKYKDYVDSGGYDTAGEWIEYHTNDIADIKWAATGTGFILGFGIGGLFGAAALLLYFWH